MSDEGFRADDAEDPAVTDVGATRLSRLKLLKIGAAGAAAAGGVLPTRAEAADRPVTPLPLRFLTKWEFDYVEAMAETLWPTDDLGPGAKVAGVAHYIDGQLAGPWGQGHRFYLNGPFLTPQDSGHGWQIPMTPSDIYRAFLPAFDVYLKTTYGSPFTSLGAATQTTAMNDLRTGKAAIALAGSTAFTSADFYTMFRQNVLEGMLSDPSYGGNRDMVGWKWVGFPGNPMGHDLTYTKWIFNDKPYPYQYKPTPLKTKHKMGGM